jgi:mono/diheme cytochrome c family protein
MRKSSLRRNAILAIGAVLTLLGVVRLAASQTPAAPSTGIAPGLTPAHNNAPAFGHNTWPLSAAALLSQPIADSVSNAAELRRGQYLVAAGDCMSCHLRENGEPFSGGLGLDTPFGQIYSSNITSDRETGIGAWTTQQFYRAMHDGIGAHGENLYPAFPYPWFRLSSRQDDDAILAYLMTTPAVHYTPPKNALPFPLNFRFMVKIWNLFFLGSHELNNNPNQSADWNRGAYLVKGLGHCGGCHTPKNFLGAEKSKQEFQGAPFDKWVAPDLTSNERTGLGGWSAADISEYLAHGRNARAGAGGQMGDVISYSTALLNDADRHAIAVYLKTQASTLSGSTGAVDTETMQRGAAIYSDVCASCHLEAGVGQPRFFPPLSHNAMLQQADPTGVEHVILAGSRIGTSPSRPSPLTMPSFAWKLTDQEIADVATYIRNSWGNRAAALTGHDVHQLREQLNLMTVHLTANSGDQD